MSSDDLINAGTKKKVRKKRYMCTILQPGRQTFIRIFTKRSLKIPENPLIQLLFVI